MENQKPTELTAHAESLPEDVAALYAWANLHGAKYRDFSASRRAARQQMLHPVPADPPAQSPAPAGEPELE